METRRVTLSFAFALIGTVAAASGCSNNVQMSFGRGGSGGDSGASGAAAGAGGSGGGSGGVDSGSGGMLTPQQIHDGLLNAETSGGTDVTRAPSTTYPSCQ
jgi:hypothetical protein